MSAVPPQVRDHQSAGFVLLETALAIPVLLAVTVALAWAITLSATALGLGATARDAARDLARGESMSTVLDRARRASPEAQVRVEDGDGSVRVIVEQQVSAPVPLLHGISVTITQQVAVPREWA